MSSLSIRGKGNLLTAFVIVGFIANFLIVYNTFSSAKQEYQKLESVLNQESVLKSLMVGGLLFNSSRQVASSHITKQKAKDTMASAIKQLESFSKELQALNPSTHAKLAPKIAAFSAHAKTLHATVEKNTVPEAKEGAKSLQLWRDLKFAVMDEAKKVKKQAAAEKENFNALLNSSEAFIGIFSLVGLLVFSAFVFFIIRSIVTPINGVNRVASDLATGEGDLTKRLRIHSGDEIGQSCGNINTFIEKIQTLVSESKKLSSENASISHELSVTSNNVGKSVEKSTSVIDSATHKAESITAEIKNAVEEAKSSKEGILQASRDLDIAKNEIVSLTSKVQDSAHVETELADRMQSLSSEAEQVKSVLEVISDIADQTNLLALNAAIEAARAGEHGRGFAVVADEVRKLAERTQKSLVEINSTISVIVQSINDASEQMSGNSQQVQELSDVAGGVEQRIGEAVGKVMDAVHDSDKTVNNFINTGKSIEQIVEQVEQINKISATNARSVEEIAGAADHLGNLTESLNSKLDQFKT